MLKEALGGYQARQAAQRLFDWIRYQPPYSLVDADPYRSALLGAALAWFEMSRNGGRPL